jgi:hypothetical protein
MTIGPFHDERRTAERPAAPTALLSNGGGE